MPSFFQVCLFITDCKVLTFWNLGTNTPCKHALNMERFWSTPKTWRNIGIGLMIPYPLHKNYYSRFVRKAVITGKTSFSNKMATRTNIFCISNFSTHRWHRIFPHTLKCRLRKWRFCWNYRFLVWPMRWYVRPRSQVAMRDEGTLVFNCYVPLLMVQSLNTYELLLICYKPMQGDLRSNSGTNSASIQVTKEDFS